MYSLEVVKEIKASVVTQYEIPLHGIDNALDAMKIAGKVKMSLQPGYNVRIIKIKREILAYT